MEITSQSQSVLQQIQKSQATQQVTGASANSTAVPGNNANSTADSISISSEGRARLQAEQEASNTIQLQGSGIAIGTRPK